MKFHHLILIVSFLSAAGLSAESKGVSVQNEASEPETDLELEQLFNILVTIASKKPENLSDAPGIISVLTSDELRRFGGTTLRDILERVPGINFMAADFTNRSTISIRGDQIKQNSGHVLFLFNGRPIREVQETGINSDILETFPVNIIERIEVIRGPGSVLYGSDAFSGVVNIITQKADKNSGSVTITGQSGKGFGSNGNVKVKKGDLELVAAARYLEKAEWKVDWTCPIAIFGDPASPPVFIDTTYHAKTPDKGPGAFIGINYKGLSLMSTFNSWETDYFTVGMHGPVMLQKFFSNAGYHHQLNDFWSMEFNATYANSKLKGDNITKRSSDNLIGEWMNLITITEDAQLTVGLLANRNDGKETQLIVEPQSVTAEGEFINYAGYAQFDYYVMDNLKLVGGIQGNKKKKQKLDIVPRIAAIWHPLRKIDFKLLYSEAFRSPSINELYLDFPFGIQGNKNLEPEKVATIDVGVNRDLPAEPVVRLAL